VSKFIPAIASIAQIGAGILMNNPALIISGGAGLLGFGAALLLNKQPDRQAQEATVKVGETPRQAIFGLGATAGNLADAFNYGGKNGTDWEVLVIDLADHECDGLEGYWLGDEYFAWEGDGTQSSVGEGQLQIWFLPGTEDQAVPAILTTHGGWSANDRGRGICRVVVAYKADAEDEKNPEMPSRPTFLWVVRGAKLYDMRLDDTVAGGAGPHRWDDPTTRTFSTNLALCDYNFDRGLYACNRVGQPDQLMIGRGLSALEAPPEAAIVAANLCDEDVALAGGGTEKRYHGGGVVSADEDFGTIKEAFAAAMGGVVTQPDGGVAVEPGHGKSAVFHFTDADLIVGAPVKFRYHRSEADRDWVNTVAARYVEPSLKWKDHGAPVRRNSADVIADGGQRLASPSLRFVQSSAHAQRIAEIGRRLGRLPTTAQVTLGPRFAGVEEGDWGTWTSARYLKGATVTFRVESYNLSEAWQNTLQLRQVAASAYSWSAADEIGDGAVAESQSVPVPHGPPEPGSWTLEATSSSAGGLPAPALRFTGASDDRYATGVVFEYRVEDPGNGPDDGWSGQDIAPASVTERVLSGVESGIAHEGAVSFQYGGVVGDRLILGPVTPEAVELVIDGQVPL
jgi:hypothetical protein